MRAFQIYLCLLLCTKIFGFTVPSFTQPVIDQAGILKPKTVQELNQALSALHESGGPQIAVLTVSSLENQTVETVSIEVVNQWKLGTKEQDNGILILIAKKEKKIRIEVGYGLEGDIPDAYAKRIIDDVMVPQFRQGNFNAGVLSGVEQVAQLTRCEVPKLSRPAKWKERDGFRLIQFLLLIFFWLPVLLLLKREAKKNKDYQEPKPWYDESRGDGTNSNIGGGRSGGWYDGNGFGGGGASGGW